MHTVRVKCPHCKSEYDVATEKDSVFCMECGTKIAITPVKTEHTFNYNRTTNDTYRKIDEARIREAEAKEFVRLKEIEFEREKLHAKKEEDKRTIKQVLLFFGLAIGLLLLLPLFEAIGII